jgi:hypothetical protein
MHIRLAANYLLLPLVGINVSISFQMKSIIFGDVTPCSLLPPAYLLVLAEIISSTLKMEAIFSSETSVSTQQTTRRYIPEDDTLHNHRCKNLKSYKLPNVSFRPFVSTYKKKRRLH